MTCGAWRVQCEVCSVKEAVRSVKCGLWSVSEVWGVKWEVWSEKCEVWTVKCGVRRAQCEVWSVKCEVWSVKEAVRSVKCGLWSVKCEWSVECEVRSEKCEVWSVKFGVGRKQWEVRSVKCGLWSVECEVRSEKCEVWSVKEAVRSEKCEVRSVKCGVWSVKCEVRSVDCEVWSVKCGLWSVKCEVWTVKCEVCSVKCEVWGLECEGSSEKWEVWSVKCGVWSLKFGVRRVQCAVWGVECRGKDTVGTGCLWTIGHLCLGNFRRRLARVYVKLSESTLWDKPRSLCHHFRGRLCRAPKAFSDAGAAQHRTGAKYAALHFQGTCLDEGQGLGSSKNVEVLGLKSGKPFRPAKIIHKSSSIFWWVVFSPSPNGIFFGIGLPTLYYPINLSNYCWRIVPKIFDAPYPSWCLACNWFSPIFQSYAQELGYTKQGHDLVANRDVHWTGSFWSQLLFFWCYMINPMSTPTC